MRQPRGSRTNDDDQPGGQRQSARVPVSRQADADHAHQQNFQHALQRVAERKYLGHENACGNGGLSHFPLGHCIG